MEPTYVPYDELVVGELYEVTVRTGDSLFITIALPYRGINAGRMVFADGPNGLYVSAEERPRIVRFTDYL